MGLTIGFGSIVVFYALYVLLRSFYLKQKAFYVTLSSLISLGTLFGISAVVFWRMFALSVGNLPVVSQDVFL
jgi:hypothetical protein